MTNKSGSIGTWTETAVVRYANEHGFPRADRRRLRGSKDVGDILLAHEVILSVKGGYAAENASVNLVDDWIGELAHQMENADAKWGFLVTKRRGSGAASAGNWTMFARLNDLTRLITGITQHDETADVTVSMTLSDGLALLAAHLQPDA